VIENLYIGLDAIVGYTLDHMRDDATLIVMSDHGFTSWRRSFHLNAWLKEKGFLVVKDPDRKDDPGLFVNVDWGHTRAYGVGMNGLYVNLRGREKNGIVPPEKRDALMDEIIAALVAEIDPVTGEPAVIRAYKREEAYQDRGELEIGPDIIVGYAKGTRGSGYSALGAVGNEIMTDNLDEWSGDHEMDPSTVPGILVTNRPLKKGAARLQDLAESVLRSSGLTRQSNPLGRKSRRAFFVALSSLYWRRDFSRPCRSGEPSDRAGVAC
jgi:predicted AlkP superfamily phosphohydrolase/phosphomutase